MFGPPAWSPVLNNVVVIAIAGLFLVLTRGDGSRTTTSLGTGEVLLLGIGTTLGIVVQALVLLAQTLSSLELVEDAELAIDRALAIEPSHRGALALRPTALVGAEA